MEKYDVALSFAGEDRLHAKELARLLKSGGYRVFYDEYEKPHLQGKNLYDELSSVYQKSSALLRDVPVRNTMPASGCQSMNARVPGQELLSRNTESIFYPSVLTIQRFPGS